MDWIEITFRIVMVIVSIVCTFGMSLTLYWIQKIGKDIQALQEKSEHHHFKLAKMENELSNNKEQHQNQTARTDHAERRISILEQGQSAVLSQLQTLNETTGYIRAQIDSIKERL